MDLTNNNFLNNIAYIGGGGIYFNNKLLNVSPYRNNKFSGNQAYFANDFYSFPIRMRFTDNKKFYSLANTSSYHLNLVPGTSNIYLYFEIIDYYNQTIESLNGR